ncbi:MAG: translation initiation factor IF-2, partial [Rickettsiales bacterium]|nr:translation initiation factor IF-2 [Rickettsiales bacterium]
VIEARQERGRGATATVLVRKGVLKKGDVFVSGGAVGKVRDMLDERGRRLDEAPPSTPVVVLGFENAPEAGDDFVVVETEAKAREVADYRRRKAARKKMVKTKSSLQELFEGIKEGKAETLPVIIKADTQGSVEAIADSLGKIPSEKVKVKVMHGGVGGINESDISLARTAGAVVLGFNVRASSDARDMARQDGVDIRYYSVIYGMIDDVKELMGGLLPPVQKEVAAGFADVIATFSSGKVRIAGCRVADGVVKKGSFARMLRNDIVVFEAKIAQLKRGKEEVKEARQGVECGISFDGRNDIEIGDRLECFDIEEEKATL